MPDSHETGPHGSGAHETMSDDAPVRRSLHLERGSALGRYVVLEPIGAGGMSIVYAAYDPELDRKVALKVLRSASDPDTPLHTRERLRLLREAQAMARLSHPNVVPIYDAGSIGDRVFLAMHYVEGQTLTRWLTQDRTWRQIVEFFVYAGRGLAAAHVAGLVHRDFKPDNVLVDHDGRVQVTDFGLARPSEGPRSVDEQDNPGASQSSASRSGSGVTPVVRVPTSLTSSGRLDRPVTLAGAILGTPAYMSPEQHLAVEVDARTDQFSFCVALWEALVGERPFAGSSVGELAFAVTRGQIRPFPRESAVPGRVRRALVRGLSRAPGDRFASMDELLAELAPRNRKRPLLVAGAAIALVGLGAGLSSLTSAAPEDPCAAARAGLDDLWGPGPRAELIRTTTTTGKLGAEVSETLARLLDRHAEQWRAVATTSCVAHRVDAVESTALFAARTRCLGRRRVDLETGLAQLRVADADHVVAIAERLFDAAPPSECQDDDRLLQTRPPPDDPTLHALAMRVEHDVDELNAHIDSTDETLARATALADEAKRTGWQALVARTLAMQSMVHELRGEIPQAESLLREAGMAAALARDDNRMLQILGSLGYMLAYLSNRVPEALAVAYLVELEVAKVEPNNQTTSIHTNLGTIYQVANQLERAEAAYAAALALMAEAEFDNAFRRTVVLNNLGTIALARGDALAARERFEQALALSTTTFGADYPRNSDNYVNLCESFLMRGELDEARPRCDRALALVDGPRPRDVAAAARALHTLAALDLAVGDFSGAREHIQRARPMIEAVFGDHSFADVSIDSMEIVASIHEGRLDVAAQGLAAFDGALATTSPVPGPLRAMGEVMHGQLAAAKGDPAAALRHYEAASEAVEVADDHPDRVLLLSGRGEALLALGRAAEARPLLERALEIRAAKGGDPYAAARSGFALAQIASAQNDGARARTLVTAAKAELALVRQRDPSFAAEVDRWLEAHP